MQDLTLEEFEDKLESACYFIYFDKLQHKLIYNCKVLEKYGFKKNIFQSYMYSFGDQQLTEPLLHRHIQV